MCDIKNFSGVSRMLVLSGYCSMDYTRCPLSSKDRNGENYYYCCARETSIFFLPPYCLVVVSKGYSGFTRCLGDFTELSMRNC